ncbi:MAG TPA: type 4a pilus biogenesis protein PilO [Candidatus Saccharimonadales bacterium]|nr:type 4a pilus biogenesis protein PilO [Candidatus Saccharimonadales bacterium]
MAKTASFTKRALISKANSTIVVATAVAAFLVVFCGVASKTLLSQASYQNRVITTKKKALSTLQSDLNARDSLVASYKTFVDTPQNVLGGNPEGTGDQDGDNAKIVLDALPSKYDFPALTTSLEKLITSQGLAIISITGVDEEVTQAANLVTGEPQPIAMPFQVQVNGSYESIKSLINVFERSIRPIQVQKIEINGSEGSMTATIDAQTFYQPEKILNIRNEVVR